MSANGATKRGASGGLGKGQADKKPKMAHAPYDATKAKSSVPHEKLSAQERKQAKRDKFAVLKKNFNIIQDASQLWELLRPRTTSPEQKEDLVNQIISKIHGKVLELANHHTASRIIQFCAKHGSAEVRAALMAEVRASLVVLSKGKHGHHLVQQLITTSKKEEVSALIAQFKGHVAELLRHPHGCDVLVDLYDVASTTQRNAMCAEFYGKEFVLFDGVNTLSGGLSGLKQLLEGANTAKKRAVYQHMTRALTPVMEKAILHPPMVHRLIREFLECAPSMSVEDAVDTLTQAGTDVLKMVHTHDGAAVVCMLLAYGSAKDRKRLIKAMKGHVHDMAVNEWGHAVLCTAVSIVDDTNLVSKSLVSELKAMLPEAVEDQYAHRVLLQLLSPDNKRYLPQAVLELMHPPQRTVVGGTGKMITDLEGDEDEVDIHAGLKGEDDGDDDGEELFASGSGRKQQGDAKPDKRGGNKGKRKHMDEEDEDAEAAEPASTSERVKGAKAKANGGNADDSGDEEAEEGATPSGPRVLGISKKEPRLRRQELLGKGPASLSAALTELVAEHTGSLLRSPHSCDVVVEVARGSAGGVLAELCPEGVQKVQKQVAALVGRGKDEEEQATGEEGPAPQQEHVMVHYYASRALRRLVLIGAEEGEGTTAAQQCVQGLWSSALEGRCKDWFGTHGDKVLAALLHCGNDAVIAAATKELKPLLKGKDPQEWSDGFIKQQAKQHKQGKQGKSPGQSPAVVKPAPQSSAGSQRDAGAAVVKSGARADVKMGKVKGSAGAAKSPATNKKAKAPAAKKAKA